MTVGGLVVLSSPHLPHAAVVRAATVRLEGPLILLYRMAFAGLPFVRLPGCGVLLHRRPTSLSIPPLGSLVGALHPGAFSPAGARPYLQMQAGLGDGGGPDPDAELLLWTRGEIKQKEVELSKLNERLRENEKKLDADGLAADKKRRLESDRIFMIKEGEYLVEALSDLRSVQKTITIAKTARLGSPSPTRTSTILELLESTEVCPLLTQYMFHFQEHASYELRSRDIEVEQLRSSTMRALKPDDAKSDVFVINGPTGVGKTRLGYEALRLLSDRDLQFVGRIEEVLGLPCVTVALYMDFNNGCGYRTGVDGKVMVNNMGLRLASSSLGVDPGVVHEKNGNSLVGLTPGAVLDAIVAGALRRAGASLAARSSSADATTPAADDGGRLKPAAVVLAVHVDEYQFYLRRLEVSEGYSTEAAHMCFKEMVSAINDWAAKAGVVFLPILSGTPLEGLDLLVTEKLNEVPLSPGRLDAAAAAELMADVITKPVKLRLLRPRLIQMLLNQDVARVALADTDCRPRFLVYVGVAVRNQLDMSGTVHLEDLDMVDWGAAVGRAMARLPTVYDRDLYKTLARLALARIPVRSVSRSMLDRTKAEEHVAKAAENGIVELCAEGEDYVTVRLPQVQLRSWGVLGVVPPSLMTPALYTWQQTEQVFGVCLNAALYPRLRSRPLTVRDLFPGALGGPQLVDTELILDQPREVYREVARSLSRKSPVLAVHPKVRATPLAGDTAVSVGLENGVFLSCAGNPVVDVRCTVSTRLGDEKRGKLHIYGQTKQSHKDKEVGEDVISNFYTSAWAATALLRSAGDDVLFVFFTNRKLTDAACEALADSYFEARPGLCVVSAEQLGDVVPPFLLTRFQTAKMQSMSTESL